MSHFVGLVVALVLFGLFRAWFERATDQDQHPLSPTLLRMASGIKRLVTRDTDTDTVDDPEGDVDQGESTMIPCDCPPEEATALCRAGRHWVMSDDPEDEVDPLREWVAMALDKGVRYGVIAREGARLHGVSEVTVKRMIRSVRAGRP